MFNTSGFREFQMTQVARISAARKAIACYSKALETGVSFAGVAVTDGDRAWLAQAINDQREVIKKTVAMTFRPGEW